MNIAAKFKSLDNLNMRMKLVVITLSVASSILLFGCKSEDPTTTTAPTKPSVTRLASSEGITPEVVTLIVDSSSHVDMVFNDYPISMSQNEKKSIINDLAYISTAPLTDIPEGCKPIGRKVYNGNGDILIEADLYCSEGCHFMVFIKNEQALFGNKLNAQGISFYERLLSQVQKN